ncbi:MAG: oligopeptide transport system substrate-binding protein [Pirellulaceae bacterium]|jgi:oligopeptide transport system substrate-binding protein
MNCRQLFLVFTASLLLLVSACGKPGGSGPGSDLKVLRLPMVTDGPKSVDPIRGSTQYENKACAQIYETLFQYKYLVRPRELEPLLLVEMPEISADGMTYKFRLKKGVRFHDDECFPDGKGREMVASDVFYSWKRVADDAISKNWWLLENTIVGFDEYHQEQNAAENFDYNADVAGMRIINDYEFEVELKAAVSRFRYVLAMFQTSVVPHEAVEKYGDKFTRHPVGTGPFTMSEEDWISSKTMVMNRNPNYRDEFYPTEYMAEDKAAGLDKAAGTKLPICDRIEFTFYVEDQPMWLKFRTREIDYTTVPAEFLEEGFIKRSKELRSEYKEEGIVDHKVPLMDFIFIGFNMEDKLVGGDSEKAKCLRQAISLAMNWNERNEDFYNGINVIYDGPIPPGLEGHPENHTAAKSYRGRDLARSRELLAKAGFPEGKGLPKLDYYVSKGGNSAEQAEMFERQLGAVGIQINKNLVDFSVLIEAVNNKKAQVFSFAWGSDYPDAENNLALFYGPNESPGSNHFNYHNEEYDKLYEQIRTMQPSPERTELYVKMRDIVIEDTPYLGSMARTRYYLVNPRLKNFKPDEVFSNWVKYLDVDESKK